MGVQKLLGKLFKGGEFFRVGMHFFSSHPVLQEITLNNSKFKNFNLTRSPFQPTYIPLKGLFSKLSKGCMLPLPLAGEL